MAPVSLFARAGADGHGKSALPLSGDIVEAWAQGYMVGSLVILILLVICNYRRHVLLHKLIVLEMMLAIWHGTFIFLNDPQYGWYLSSTALLLFISYQIHNIVAFMKIRLFLPRWGRIFFLVTLAMVQPFWVVEAWDNFTYFNTGSNLNSYTRPWEALARDPWWIFTTVWLLYKIKNKYQLSAVALLSTSPRFGVMIVCMFLSIIFMIVDVVVVAGSVFQDTGINPFWRLTLVFKCAADTIFLDDFKSVLDKIIEKRFHNIRRGSDVPTLDTPAVIRKDSIVYPPTAPAPTAPLPPLTPAEREAELRAAAGADLRPPRWFTSTRSKSRSRSRADESRKNSAGGFQHLELAESKRTSDSASGESRLPLHEPPPARPGVPSIYRPW